MRRGIAKSIQLYTIGHSNRSLDEFLLLLEEFKIGALADVRRYPTSRKFPHFNSDSLSTLMHFWGLRYLWFEALGGRRHSAITNESLNRGLHSQGFRNYADHMMTDEFRGAVLELLEVGKRFPTVIMCAERFFWRCHRRLLCDFLMVQGVSILHIIDRGSVRPHKLMPGAVVMDDGTVIYP